MPRSRDFVPEKSYHFTITRSILENNTSEIHWSYFHLSPLQRVVITPPAPPVYTISIRGVITMKIEAIQVGMVTLVVPPRAPVLPGTVCICVIVVLLLS